MPSPKTAEAPKTEELIEVVAVRKFAVDYSAAELKELKANDRDNRSQKGMTKNIEVGESAFISKMAASKLQDAGAVKVKL